MLTIINRCYILLLIISISSSIILSMTHQLTDENLHYYNQITTTSTAHITLSFNEMAYDPIVYENTKISKNLFKASISCNDIHGYIKNGTENIELTEAFFRCNQFNSLPIKIALESHSNTYNGFLQIGLASYKDRSIIGAKITAHKKFKPTMQILGVYSFDNSNYKIVPVQIQFICQNNKNIQSIIDPYLNSFIKHPIVYCHNDQMINQAVQQKIVSIRTEDRLQLLNICKRRLMNRENDIQLSRLHAQLLQAGEKNPLNKMIKKELKKKGYPSVHTMVQSRQYGIH